LPGDYGVSATFNVANLSPYLEDDHVAHLREILLIKERMMEGHHGTSSRASRHFWRVKIELQGQGKGPSIDRSICCSAWVKDMHKPDFVYLLEGDLDAIIFSMPHPHLA